MFWQDPLIFWTINVPYESKLNTKKKIKTAK